MNKSKFAIHHFPNNFLITNDFETISSAMVCIKNNEIQSANCGNLEKSPFNDFLLSCLFMDLFPDSLYKFWMNLYVQVHPKLSELSPRYPTILQEDITLNNDLRRLIAFFGNGDGQPTPYFGGTAINGGLSLFGDPTPEELMSAMNVSLHE